MLAESISIWHKIIYFWLLTCKKNRDILEISQATVGSEVYTNSNIFQNVKFILWDFRFSICELVKP